MCFHFSNTAKAKELEEEYRAKIDREFEERYHANGFTFPDMPVITNDEPDRIQFLKWGLIPFWAKDKKAAEGIKSKTLNARSETLTEKPSFKTAIKKRRCLIPATGFFEWKHVKGNKIPHFIHLKDRKLFSFGGIWDTWTDKDTGETIKTFSIITTPANELMENIHNTKKRMPLILPKELEMDWLEKDISMEPYPTENMDPYPISKLITDGYSNVPEVLEREEYEELG